MRFGRLSSVVIGAFLTAGHAASAAGGPSAPNQADATLVERGAYLAKAGDCEACHTAPNGAPYAGGAALNSPFGPLYPPNITPDPTHGIGAWTDEQFYHAMHDGVGHNGENLYPAFPYQWFTKVTRDDVTAIRAYLRTVPASSAASRPNRLLFPFDVRAGLSAWNALYFHPGEFRPDPAKPEAWNRGAYLVEGLGHCGDCHTPKGLGMEPIASRAFAGGAIDNWYAPNITSDPKEGIGAWSEDDLVRYFKTGMHGDKGVVAGPMAQVVHDSLSKLTDSDLHAMAAFLKSIEPVATYKPERPSGETGPHPSGVNAYVTNCAFCHQLDGKGRPGAVPALAGNDLVRAKGPQDVIRVILGGHLATGTFAPMPAVGNDMTDAEIRDVVDYVRTAWSNAAPVVDTTGLVGSIRAETVTGLAGRGAKENGDDACLVRATSPRVPAIDDSQISDALAAMKPYDMLSTIPAVVTRARSVASNPSQADLVNGLMLAYCRVQAKSGDLQKPGGRRNLDQFGQLVYSELVSKGRE
jgi:mono/diheme cytochrome c family protein